MHGAAQETDVANEMTGWIVPGGRKLGEEHGMDYAG